VQRPRVGQYKLLINWPCLLYDTPSAVVTQLTACTRRFNLCNPRALYKGEMMQFKAETVIGTRILEAHAPMYSSRFCSYPPTPFPPLSVKAA
jgi:hypothetical protein